MPTIPILIDSLEAQETIETNHFAGVDGTPGGTYGVCLSYVEPNEVASIMVLGIAEVQAATAISAGDMLSVDPVGCVYSDPGGRFMAKTSGAPNDLVQVLLR